MDGLDGLDGWIGCSRSKGQALTLALAMPPPAASAPAPGVLEVERLASVGASTPGKATASVSASTPGKATPADGQCFDAWPRRHRKRKEAIAAIKRSQEYKDLCKCSQEYQDSWQLDEPDPTDRSISKRAWERAVGMWRFDLRLAAGIFHAV